jgi:hypothetical protein
MAKILCVYRQLAMLRGIAESGESGGGASLALVSYDEKPGIQAIGTTAPDRPPLPGISPTVMRDHEYKRHGTLTLMAGIDLLTGHVHALVKERHRSREFIEFLKLLDAAYLGFLIHEGGANTIPDAAYRFVRHEPGVDVVLFGTGDPEHLRTNIASILHPQAAIARARSRPARGLVQPFGRSRFGRAASFSPSRLKLGPSSSLAPSSEESVSHGK